MSRRCGLSAQQSTTTNAIKRTTEDWITAWIIADLPSLLSRSIGQGDLILLRKASHPHCLIMSKASFLQSLQRMSQGDAGGPNSARRDEEPLACKCTADRVLRAGRAPCFQV